MRYLELHPLRCGELGQKRQPGLSAYDKGRWRHGREALEMCRVDPQSTSYRLWEDLSLEENTLPGKLRHFADLGVLQLEKICDDLSRDCWTVFTPSHWTKEQLQIFLGIAQVCKMDVRALVPRGLAAASFSSSEQEDWMTWEWHWSRLNLVRLKKYDNSWKMIACEKITEGGILDFFKRESRFIAQRLLESQRVDPLYSGKTEQLFFDGWVKWHLEKTPWVMAMGSKELELEMYTAQLSDVHTAWVSTQHLDMTLSHQSYPEFLKHCLGDLAGTRERNELSDIGQYLGDLSTPGTRWRDELALEETTKRDRPLRVTHWVIDGVAEPANLVQGQQPGQQVELPDGRTALAIHVPEHP